MLIPLLQFKPRVHSSAFIARGALVIGRCRLAKNTSIWYNAVLRGDVHQITIGEGSNVQDGSILHVDHDAPLQIGKHVTVGHHANLHGCRVGDGAVIGIGAIVLSHATVGKGAVVAAGSLVPEGASVPAGKMVMGIPARVVRDVRRAEAKTFAHWARHYVTLACVHRRANDALKCGRRG